MQLIIKLVYRSLKNIRTRNFSIKKHLQENLNAFSASLSISADFLLRLLLPACHQQLIASTYLTGKLIYPFELELQHKAK